MKNLLIATTAVMALNIGIASAEDTNAGEIITPEIRGTYYQYINNDYIQNVNLNYLNYYNSPGVDDAVMNSPPASSEKMHASLKIPLMYAVADPDLGGSENGDKWHFVLAPYASLFAISGTAGVLPNTPAEDIDLSFGDLKDNIDGGFQLYGSARKGRYGLAADFIWGKITSETELDTPLFGELILTSESLMVMAAGTYRLVEGKENFLDAFVGARLWNVKVNTRLTPGIFPGLEDGNERTWVDPWLGVAGQTNIGGKFYLNGTAAVGGFGLSSDFSWEISANLGYQWNDWFATILGYRILAVDYESGDDFLYDIRQHGLNLGMIFNF